MNNSSQHPANDNRGIPTHYLTTSQRYSVAVDSLPASENRMNKLQQIYGIVVITAFVTGGLFVFVGLNPEIFKEDTYGWCATDDSTYAEIIFQHYDHPGRKVFNLNCVTCHSASTSEIVVGPSLKEVTQRRDKQWIGEMILHGQKLVEQKDQYAVEQYEKYNRIVHPDFEYLSEDALNDLIEYLELEGGTKQ
ncbi:cytochrome c [Rhodocytophaga aerolata]|uniref:Cytochrome c n=1 Tax=Rhodocytophaga aerolata TaxID=455078 RepID=A0ABT8RK05_9BACT|nr:cytochrome c [Rhodocytophaga aerolata]MDO1451854.1 cytochrome c [Rhodocytophaga aerolata]